MSSLIPKCLPRTLVRKTPHVSPLRTTFNKHTQRTLLAGFSTRTPVGKSTAAHFPQRISLCNPSPRDRVYGRRSYATATPADALIEDLTEQYGVARDEFEIASEETDKHSVYAEADRAAAVEELQKLKDMYTSAIEGEYGEEIKRRVGSRVRELEQGVAALEARALEDH
ncbi:hypothetical protein BCON_0001g00560 [Botryotinia convoluta]|uniref:Uncharacterized protein n=1 Tax=Botryotinia convoluta TaxID=54673 RepID=A0A4Z1IWH8_9HELO|nr:hypothetical protein BCON_0001g00560 [Botryotinia convoluta]